jgi:hypothetical protein
VLIQFPYLKMRVVSRLWEISPLTVRLLPFAGSCVCCVLCVGIFVAIVAAFAGFSFPYSNCVRIALRMWVTNLNMRMHCIEIVDISFIEILRSIVLLVLILNQCLDSLFALSRPAAPFRVPGLPGAGKSV